MIMSTARLVLALVFAASIAGCAGSRTAATPEPPPPHPLEGAWSYAVNTPQGTFTGTLIFTAVGDSLSGAIATDDNPDDLLEFGVEYDSETATATCSFDTGEFGIMDLTLHLEGEALTGTQFARDYNFTMDVSASRKEEESASQ